MGTNAAPEMDATDFAAGAVAALAIHCIAERNLGARISEVGFFRPLQCALYEAALELPSEAPEAAHLLRPSDEGAAATAWAVYRRMVLDEAPLPRTAFHSVLFRRLAHQPDIEMLIAPAASKPSVTKLPETILGLIGNIVTKGLDIFLESHSTRTYGFHAWAKQKGFLSEEPNEERDRIEEALSILVLGAPWMDYRAKRSRTLIPWVEGGWSIRDRGTDERVKLESIVLQALVGANLSAKGRASGALRQGLITGFFREYYNLPLLTDCEVPVVQCPSSEKKQECIFSLRGGHIICGGCRQPIADGTHDIWRRRNIDVLGPVIRPAQPEDVQAVTESPYPVWAKIELAVCPGERAIETALAASVLREVETEVEVRAVHALAQQPITLDELLELIDALRHERSLSLEHHRTLRRLGAALETFRKIVQRRLKPQLDTAERAKCHAVLKNEELATAGERVLTLTVEHSFRLRGEVQHLVTSRGARCDRPFQADKDKHGQASIRPITVYIRVDDQSTANDSGDEDAALEFPSGTEIAEFESELAAILQAWTTRPTHTQSILLRALGQPPARRLIRLLQECDASAQTPEQRVGNTPTLLSMWESLSERDKDAFRNQWEFVEAVADMLTKIANIAETGEAKVDPQSSLDRGSGRRRRQSRSWSKATTIHGRGLYR